MPKIKVLIVDDSAIVRNVLKRAINNERDMEVVGTAPDPYIARDKIVKLKPDVMTLDVEMPKMDGITFLSKVMHYFPIPTIIVSSITQRGCSTSVKAFELGAIEVIPKPSEKYSIQSIERKLVHAVRAAANAKIEKIEKKKVIKYQKAISIEKSNKILAIGASTGGTEAIKNVLIKLPANTPGTVIVQHMPPYFTNAFAKRLDSICAMEVREAVDGDLILPGVALIAPGDYHMVIRYEGAKKFVRVKKGPQVWHQRPAVDILFKSVAKYAGKYAVGVLLTGMGKDGGEGLKLMRDAGAKTIAQNQETCVVFGMPKVAIELGGADFIEPIEGIAKKIALLL